MIEKYLKDSLVAVILSPLWIGPVTYLIYSFTNQNTFFTTITFLCCLVILLIILLNDAFERDKKQIDEININTNGFVPVKQTPKEDDPRQIETILNEGYYEGESHDLTRLNEKLREDLSLKDIQLNLILSEMRRMESNFAEDKKLIQKGSIQLQQENTKLKSELQRIQFLYNTAKDTLDRKNNTVILAKIFEKLEEKMLKLDTQILENKSNPAYKAADKIREYSRETTRYYRELVTYKRLVSLYEQYYPNLEAIRLDEFDIESNELEEDPSVDIVKKYVSTAEYENLTVTERNQRALDRFINKHHKKKQIGEMFERYVGYMLELENYDVEYYGLKEEKEDLGRDLIAKKGKKTIIIQCKYWSENKEIHENHINQLFGTAIAYKIHHSKEDVSARMYSHGPLSSTALEFAEVFSAVLPVEIKQGIHMPKDYPMIKCNIDPDGEKIYHLPFDQQYDYIKIEKNKGELYAQTVVEAENAGFRRAWRWSGAK